MRIKRFKTVLDDSNGHTGDTGAKIPVPSIWKSLYLSYPKAFLCTTFLYKDSKYALRNALFVLGSLRKVASVALLPVLALVLACMATFRMDLKVHPYIAGLPSVRLLSTT